MDPLNQLNAMHLHEPLPAALDLSMGCKDVPVKTNSMEALDLVKKSSWSDCNSGTNDVVVGAPGARSESHISKPFKQVQTDVPQLAATSEFLYESRCSAAPLHSPSSVPLLNGQPLVTETLSQCPTLNKLFTEESRAGAEMDKGFTQPSECPRKTLIAASEMTKTDIDKPLRAKDPTEGEENKQNGLNSRVLYVKAGCREKCTTDTVSARTRTRNARILQDSTSFTPSLHSTDSARFISQAMTRAERSLLEHEHGAVETQSKCAASDENSSCSVECISSDDSDVIEVPVSNSTNRQSSNRLLLTGRKMSHERKTPSSPRQGSDCADGTTCSAPENMAKNGYHSIERGVRNPAEMVEPGEPLSPAVLLDSDPETEFVSKNFPSTSDTENTEHALGQPQDEGLSLSSSPPLVKDGPRGVPVSKKQNESSAGPEEARPAKLTRLCPGSKEAASAAKRRRRKARPSGPSSIFAPQEPEIKLKYANYKEEKREGGGHSFAPYIRVELSACTIVNFQEEDDEAQVRKGRQAIISCVSPGVVPSTSHLVLGRLSAGSTRSDQVCCLCGKTSNTSGLGDLHGPYYPYGPQPNSKTHHHPVEGAFLGPPQTESPLRVDRVLDSEEISPTKRLRKECSTEEWPGAPGGGADCRERWVHEDCSVWSAGVFLVKGKLYGLEEALRLTQETVCSCCHGAGATLGCFFKGCPNKYHFPCAVQADCVLSEENFTMRCPKHKNKSPRTSTSRLQNR